MMSDSGLLYDEISEPYYFESDHIVLKENADYRNLLQSVAILEAQRQQAALDIETLYKAQDEALADPFAFVEKLQKGQDLGFPQPQKIAPLPAIQWEKYTTSVNFSSFGSSRHMTRNKKIAPDNGDAVLNLKSKLIQGASSTNTFGSGESLDYDGDVKVVRGRTRDCSKPATFNQLWTEEEQQKLESLLIQYPPEEIESRRWSKIADALGNRTPIQVASRVQKYFLRLAKEGLPVPGRMPNLSAHSKKNSHRHHRYNRMYYPSSTMLQSHVPPVWMPEDGSEHNIGSYIGGICAAESVISSETTSQKDESSEEEDYPVDIINSSEFQELQRLKQLRREKLGQKNQTVTRHIGFKCDNCGCEPIIGTRWHCVDCPSDVSFDFCDGCSDVPFQQDKHDSSHRLQPFVEAVLDADYMSFTKADYNYLDPNYMPAS